MAFDKTKPLHVVVDTGKGTKQIFLTEHNDWSMDNLGVWFYIKDNTKWFYPWTSVVEMIQFKAKNSNGKNDEKSI